MQLAPAVVHQEGGLAPCRQPRVPAGARRQAGAEKRRAVGGHEVLVCLVSLFPGLLYLNHLHPARGELRVRMRRNVCVLCVQEGGVEPVC